METSSSFLDASRFSSLHRTCALPFEGNESNLRTSPPSLPDIALDNHLVSAHCNASARTESSSDLLFRNATPNVPSCPSLLSQCSYTIDDVKGGRESVITGTGKRLEKLRIFVGFDSREEIAYDVCRHSILKHATINVEIIPLKLQNLVEQGLYTRSRAPTESTEFSFTRFLTPFLAGYEGWAMFIDCDFLYTADVRELAELINDQFAIMCVKHNYTPKATVKMDGVVQTSYPRKNWSSMVLYNCSHPKNKVLTPKRINSESGAFLHRFMWLEDVEIGEIPFSWNFLVGHNEVPDGEASLPKAIHFTCGGPWFEAYKDCEFADCWLKERDDYLKTQMP